VTVLVQDNFDGAAGTDLPDHTPDIDVEGGGWSVITGANADFELDGSGACEVNNPGGFTRALIDCGKSDIKITGNSTILTNEANCLLYFRAVDAANHWVLFQERFALGSVILRKVVAGTPTNVTVFGPPAPFGAGSIDFEITAEGDTITYKDLTNAIEISAVDSQFQTATLCGFGDLSSDDPWLIDYTIEDLEDDGMALPTTPGRAFNKVKRDPGTARAVYEAPIAPVLSMENEALGAGAFAPVRPNAQIYGLLVQAIGDAIRFSVAGDSPASATVGFRLIVDDPPILIPIGPGVFPSFFGEGAGAILAYQWTA